MQGEKAEKEREQEKVGRNPYKSVIFDMMGLAVILIGIVAMALWWQIHFERQTQLQSSMQVSGNLAKGFEEYVRRNLAEVDEPMLLLKERYEGDGKIPFDLWQQLAENPIIPSKWVVLTDDRGRVRTGSWEGSGRGQDISRQDYFLAQSMEKGDQLYVGKPYQDDESHWIVPLSRRLNGEDGGFAGILAIGVHTRYFSGFYQQMNMTTHQMIALVGRDGVVRAVPPENEGIIGKDISGSQMFRQLGMMETGFYEEQLPFLDQEGIYSYRSMADYPLVIVAGAGKETLMAGFYQRRTQYVAAAVVIIGFIFLTFAMLIRMLRNNAAAETLQAALYRITEKMEGLKDPTEVFRFAHHALAEFVPIRNFYVAIRGKNGNAMRFPYYIIEGDRHPAGVPGVRQWTEMVMENGKAVVLDEGHPHYLTEEGKATDSTWWMGAPIRVQGGDVIGVMAVHGLGNRQKERERYLAILSFVAAQAGMIMSRKQAEDALRTNEEKLRRIIDRGWDIVGLLNGEGRTEYVSESFTRILGYTVEETIGRMATDFIHEEDVERVTEALEDLRQNRVRVRTVDFRSIHKDGWLVWMEYVISNMLGEPSVRAIVINGREITQRKAAEVALRKLNEELEERVSQRTAEVEDLYNNAPCGYHSLDSSGMIVHMNDTELQWLGYEREEVIGHKKFSDFLFPDALTEFWENFALFMERGWVKDLEYQLKRRDGTSMSVLVTSTAVYDRDGRYNTSRTTVYDITGLKEAEQAVKEKERQLQEFLDNASDLIQSCDNEGNFLYVNQAWLDSLGYAADEIKDLGMKDVLEPEGGRDGEGRELLGRGKFRFRQEVSYRTKSGNIINLEGMSSGHYQKEGAGATYSILRDITLRKQAEETLRYSRDQLQEANAELERAVRMKDEFLATMSHELRTPLTGVIGLAELLKNDEFGPMSAEQQQMLGIIEESGKHLLEIINDILDLSKMEAKLLTLDMEECDVEGICRASLQFIKEAVRRKNQQVDLSIEPEGIRMMADGRRLKQMLVNLLGNAVKFTPEGGELGLEVRGDKEKSEVSFTVWDEGIGIAKEDFPKLFRPFTQLERTLSRQHAGTGLGLVIVWRMAELQGGSVHVESEPGRGSRFTVVLPWQPINTDGEKGKAYGDEQDGEQLGRLSEKRFGREMHTCSIYDDVVEAAVKMQAGLVLCKKTGDDGRLKEVLASLKGDERTAGIPILLVTAMDFDWETDMYPELAGLLRGDLRWNDFRRKMGVYGEAGRPVLAVGPETAPMPLILLAEDNEVNALYLQKCLPPDSYRLIHVVNGQDAVMEGKLQKPDLIVMDIQMPVMDGLQAIQAIRQDKDPQVAQVPIIALTALTMTGDRERCVEAGANAYISKPVRAGELRELVEKQLDYGEK